MNDDMIENGQDMPMDAENGADTAAARISALEAELASAKQDVLYAAADIQNTRRRAEKEIADARAYSVSSFARDLLSVADNFERALASIPEDLRGDERVKGLITGIEGTARELNAVLERHGVTKIAALGEMLDPNLHQAMLELPSDAPAGTIVQEMQAGYRIKDRLLRPAMVGVAKAD